jgi:hypothetical protein
MSTETVKLHTLSAFMFSFVGLKAASSSHVTSFSNSRVGTNLSSVTMAMIEDFDF